MQQNDSHKMTDAVAGFCAFLPQTQKKGKIQNSCLLPDQLSVFEFTN